MGFSTAPETTSASVSVPSNSIRNRQQLSSLTLNEELSKAAQAKADDMATKHYFEHTAPDGTTGWSFINQTSYQLAAAGENLAISNSTAQEITSNWFKSPTHRANLLSKVYQDVGYGVAKVGDWDDPTGHYKDMYFVVAFYASPKTTAEANEKPVYTNGGIGVVLSRRSHLMLSDIAYFLGGAALGITAGVLFITKLVHRKQQAHSSE
jgi:hypothetical protein